MQDIRLQAAAAWIRIDRAHTDPERQRAETEYRRLRDMELAARTPEELAQDAAIDKAFTKAFGPE